MSKKSKIAKRMKKSPPLPKSGKVHHPEVIADTRPLFVTREDAELLDRLLDLHSPNSSLRGDVKRIIKEFSSVTLRIKELAIQATANGFWMEDKATQVRIVKNVGNAAKERRQRAEEAVEAADPEEIKRLVVEHLAKKRTKKEQA